MEIKVTNNFRDASARFEEKVRKQTAKTMENALNNQAFAARAEVQKQIQRVFRNPEDATINSVHVIKVQAGSAIDDMVARVYIADDLPKGSVQPAKYLLTEEAGGLRVAKRGEKVLIGAGILPRGVMMVPGPALPLDAHGQPTGAGIVQMLSRLRAFSEGGFRANATDATRKKLIRAARSRAGKLAREAGGDAAAVKVARAGAFVPVVNRTGNEFFLAKSQLTDGYSGVFKLVARGVVEPVVWFATKQPSYSARFPFRKIVGDSLRSSRNEALRRAVEFVGKSKS